MEDQGDLTFKKLATLYALCLKISNVPAILKDANNLLTEERGDVRLEELLTDQLSFNIIENIQDDKFE